MGGAGHGPGVTGQQRVSVVVATRDRRESLLRTLGHLAGGPPVVVVDNGSQDGTPDAVRGLGVRVVELRHNAGALARNVGVQTVTTRHVAFADDDSWWEPGALERAADLLDTHPRVGLLVGQVRLARDGAVDHVSRKHAAAVLGRSPGAPGPDVLSVPACAVVVRREAFRAVGGFDPLLFFGGEEHLLALDLAAAGWQLVHAEDVVAWHDPAGPATPTTGRWVLQTRNDLLVDWLRRPLPVALAGTVALTRRALREPLARRALADLLRRLPSALRRRREISPELEARFRRAQQPLP